MIVLPGSAAPHLTPCKGNWEPTGKFSPNGKFVALLSTSREEALTSERPILYGVYEVATGRQLCKINPDGLTEYGPRWPDGFAFSENEKYIAVSANQLNIVDPRTGRILSTIEKKQKDIHRYDFSHDDRMLFAAASRSHSDGRYDKLLSLWDVKTGRAISDTVIETGVDPGLGGLDGLCGETAWVFDDSVSAIALCPANRLIAVNHAINGVIEIWEAPSGKKRGVLKGHVGSISDLAFSPDGRYLASSSYDGTVLIWDMHLPLNPIPTKRRANPKTLDEYWHTFSQPDARKAESAIYRMIDAPADSVPYLAKKLKQTPPLDAKRVNYLIDTLESSFRKRTKAFADLKALGALALPQLSSAFTVNSTLERKRQLKLLIDHADNDRLFGEPERMRLGRALEVLEKINNPAARRLLQRLADGAEGAWLTYEANAALRRMNLRGKLKRR